MCACIFKFINEFLYEFIYEFRYEFHNKFRYEYKFTCGYNDQIVKIWSRINKNERVEEEFECTNTLTKATDGKFRPDITSQ